MIQAFIEGLSYTTKFGIGNAFAAIAGIDDSTQISALNKLYKDLLDAGLLDKMEAVYPFVGGTANAHRLNLKDITKHAITFNTSTHSSYGVVTGTDSPNLNLNTSDCTSNLQNSFHASIYTYNNLSNELIDWGGYPDTTYRVGAHIRYTDNKSYYDHGYSNTAGRVSVTVTDSTKLFIFNKLNNDQSIYRDGQILATGTRTYPPTNKDLRLNPTGNSNLRQFLFASFGEGLTESEIVALTNIVNEYQTRLGRAV